MKIQHPFILKDFILALALPLFALGLQYYYYGFCDELCRHWGVPTDLGIMILFGIPSIIVVLNYLSLYKFQKIEFFKRTIFWLTLLSPLIFYNIVFGIRGTVLALTIINYILISITGLTLLITIGRGLMALKK